ncbi:MAG: ferritin family protein [Sedimentisphaerales bacterium]|nr:ferritin family protein [Sedimentisphaerales bacterium]
MTIPFNANEIFEMAQEIERNGAKFYRSAANIYPQFINLFTDLASMEDDHEKTFKKMQNELAGPEVDPPVFDPDGEAEMYLQVMADDQVFDTKTDPSTLLNKNEAPGDVLRMAITLEKDSIAFYVGLRESVSQKAGKDKIDMIIRQEYSHIVTLSKKLSEIE